MFKRFSGAPETSSKNDLSTSCKLTVTGDCDFDIGQASPRPGLAVLPTVPDAVINNAAFTTDLCRKGAASRRSCRPDALCKLLHRSQVAMRCQWQLYRWQSGSLRLIGLMTRQDSRPTN